MVKDIQIELTELVSFSLIGAFQVIDQHGRDCTPKSAKTCGLLAMVLLAPNGVRNRNWLRSKLWSDKDEAKSRASLRQSIAEIKRNLGDYFDLIFCVDSHTISCNLARIYVDILVIRSGTFNRANFAALLHEEFLEGLSVNDEEFEYWLTLERSSWDELRDQLPLDSIPATASPFSASKTSIGLLPCTLYGEHSKPEGFANKLLEHIVALVGDYIDLEIVDTRWSKSDYLNINPNAYVQLKIGHSGSHCIEIVFAVFRGERLELCWSIRDTIADSLVDSLGNAPLLEFVSVCSHRLLNLLIVDSPSDNSLFCNDNKIIWDALSSLYTLDKSKYQSISNNLSIQSEKGTLDFDTYRALTAFSLVFEKGEFGKIDTVRRTEQMQEILSDFSIDKCENSLLLALLGHSVSFVFNNYEIAVRLLQQSLKVNPYQLYAWDSLAMVHVYNGNAKEALVCANRAVALGLYSPNRFSFDTTMAISSFINGRFDMAVEFGKKAISRQPNYLAAWRWLLPAANITGRDNELVVPAVIQKTITAEHMESYVRVLSDEHVKEALINKRNW